MGTVAQKYIGLYEAERLFFSSFVYWLFGVVPLPGGYTLMGIFSLSLLLKFLLKSAWTKAQAGINLAHLGAILLLAGGVVSSLLAQDGAMTIAEGARAAQVRDYHQRDLMLVQENALLAAIGPDQVRAGATLSFRDLPVQITVEQVWRNSTITVRETPSDDLRGMARGMQVTPAAPGKTDESNVAGMSFRISGLDEAQNGRYLIFEDGPTTKLTINGQAYELAYGKSQRTLPFTVELTDVAKINYPGTDTARAYTSQIVVHDGALSWPAQIAMNQPLRYRGYTLYQSSYLLGQDGKEYTVLAVSHDAGQFLPYLGTLVMAIGLILHLFLRRRRKGSEPLSKIS